MFFVWFLPPADFSSYSLSPSLSLSLYIYSTCIITDFLLDFWRLLLQQQKYCKYFANLLCTSFLFIPSLPLSLPSLFSCCCFSAVTAARLIFISCFNIWHDCTKQLRSVCQFTPLLPSFLLSLFLPRKFRLFVMLPVRFVRMPISICYSSSLPCIPLGIGISWHLCQRKKLSGRQVNDTYWKGRTVSENSI